jgi:hypothetical protein
MHFISEKRLNDDVVEREFTINEVPGLLWSPVASSAPRPLIMLGHPGDLRRMYGRLSARAADAVTSGFAAATI